MYLRELRLYATYLEELPADFCRTMLHLKLLGLSHNKLRELPNEINRLRELEELYLENNLFEDCPYNIFSLPRLQVGIMSSPCL